MCESEREMTNKITDTRERISLRDIVLAKCALDFYERECRSWTYAFDITSDTVADCEETGT